MKTIRIILFFAVITIFYSCENFDWFRTDKGLSEEIQGTWKREFLGAKIDYEEDWIFSDGKITILQLKNNIYDTIDVANFSTDGKLTVSYLKIDGITDSSVASYNNKWTITQLDSKVLYLVSEGTKGILQREFEKK